MATIFEQAVDKIKKHGEDIVAGLNTITVDTTAKAVGKINELLGGSGNKVDQLTKQAQDHPFVYTLVAAGAVYTYGTLAAAQAAQASKGGTIVTPAGETLKNTTSSVVNDINGYIKTAKDAVSTFVKPITDTINTITSTVRSINDGLIQPIIKPIQTITSQYSTLVSQLHSDIAQGLSGIIKIPGQISDALTSVDASLSRSMQQLGTFNRETAEQVLGPAIYQAGTKPLEGLNATLSATKQSAKDKAAFLDVVHLKEEAATEAIQEAIDKFENFVTDNDSFWGPIINYLFQFLYVGDYLIKQLENQAIPWEHHVKEKNPYNALGVGEVIEAWRRNVLTKEDASSELAKNGFNADRQRVLYDIAQFLFSPTDTVNLLARGAIDQTTFDQLMDQNNLSPEQAKSLQDLLAFIFSPGDAVQAYIRGFISEQEYYTFQKANKVDELQARLIHLLNLRPITAPLYLQSQGRRRARLNGFLSQSFNSLASEEVKTAYNHAGVVEQQAEIDQLMHWRLPPPEWWIDAYFRGIRTREECYQAFEASNVPKEIWDDMFVVLENFPSVFQIPSMLGAGAIPPEDAHAILKKLGFSEKLATQFVDFGLNGAKTTKAETAGTLQSLSLGNAKALFNDGVLTADQYHEVLVEHGYSDEAAGLTVQLAQIDLARQQRNDYATFLIDEVKLGNVNVDDAVSELYNNGYTDLEVAKYQLKMRQAIQGNTKLPSHSELNAMLKANVIDGNEWLSTMQVLGYSEYWATKLYQLAVK